MLNKEYFNDKNLKQVSGYAETKYVPSYLVYPKSLEDLNNIINIAIENKISICCRGNGLSYADLVTNKDNILIDLTLFKNIKSWSKDTGIIDLEPGVSFGDVFNLTMLDGWILPCCPGSMDITIGGAISNNVHGKDSYKMGNFGNNVISMKVLLSSGKIIYVSRKENAEIFKAIIGGMGLLGIIIEAKLKLKKISSPFVETSNVLSKNIYETIEVFDKYKDEYDFSVAWADCFSSEQSLGRGFVSLAKWSGEKKIEKKLLEKSLIKSNRKSNLIFNVLPSKPTWFILKYFANRQTFKYFNKFFYNYNVFKKSLGLNLENKLELFNNFNFLHNKMPDIKNIHKPYGFLEFQPLLPIKNIDRNIKEILLLCKKFKTESLLCGVKLHKADEFFLSYQLDGFSLGIDIQIKGKKREDIRSFSNDLFDLVSDCGGKIYLAKDEYMTNQHLKRMYPNIDLFLNLKKQYDNKGVFSSDLFKRILND